MSFSEFLVVLRKTVREFVLRESMRVIALLMVAIATQKGYYTIYLPNKAGDGEL